MQSCARILPNSCLRAHPWKENYAFARAKFKRASVGLKHWVQSVCGCVRVCSSAHITCAVKFKQFSMTHLLQIQKCPAGREWMVWRWRLLPRSWWAQWARRQMPGWVKDGSMWGECVLTAEAMTGNSQSCAPAASSSTASDRSPFSFLLITQVPWWWSGQSACCSAPIALKLAWRCFAILQNDGASLDTASSCYWFTLHMWPADKAPVLTPPSLTRGLLHGTVGLTGESTPITISSKLLSLANLNFISLLTHNPVKTFLLYPVGACGGLSSRAMWINYSD